MNNFADWSLEELNIFLTELQIALPEEENQSSKAAYRSIISDINSELQKRGALLI